MLRKRVIFTLIYNEGFFMQSRNFRLQKVGDINWLQKFYKFSQIAFSLDELIILNTNRGEKNMESFSKIVSSLVENTFIPIAVGGGIRSGEDAQLLFQSGADKIVLNTKLYESPELISQLVERYGSQSVVASIDYKKEGDTIQIYTQNGTNRIDKSLEEYLLYLKGLKIGEIYLNSIEKDGTGFGYDLSLVETVKKVINVPLIIAGGAGNEKHLSEALQKTEIDAVATANLFNFIGNGLPNARKYLLNLGFNIANWNDNK